MKKVILQLLFIITLIVTVTCTVKFDFTADSEGIYLLKGRGGYLFEVKNDIFLGEYEFLLSKIEFRTIRTLFFRNAYADLPRETPYIKYKWDEKNGDGYFMTMYPDGTKLLSCFGRYVDDTKNKVHGLFVGGGIPLIEYEHDKLNLNETGVAFFNGKKWLHVWCIANEVLYSASDPFRQILPSSWEYRGSKVLVGTGSDLIIKSLHQVSIDGNPLQIDRYLIYHAGDKYFTLINRFRNTGTKPVGFNYLYGDEPWIGDFGSSTGNVGWTKRARHNYETAINPYDNNYLGMYDIGNPAAGEVEGRYTGLANFIEWFGTMQPDFAYFSNQFGSVAPESKQVPLNHKTNRVMAIQWSDQILQPGGSGNIVLAIGMADGDKGAELPHKPAVTLDPSIINNILGM